MKKRTKDMLLIILTLILIIVVINQFFNSPFYIWIKADNKDKRCWIVTSDEKILPAIIRYIDRNYYIVETMFALHRVHKIYKTYKDARSGLQAVILIAEMQIPKTRPEGKSVEFKPRVRWKEQKKTLTWDKLIHGKEKWAFKPYTEEEIAEMRLNEAWRLGEMFKFILEKCVYEFDI
jgi:hypothetical protein